MLTKITGTYERKARLYPALLALIPPIGIVVGVYGFTLQVKSGSIGLLATFGVFYLLASIVRELGKRLENSLFDEWGGKPTTKILRHRDQTIDPITKARYHAFLAKQIGLIFPSVSDERDDPIAADHSYQSGVRWLLDQTRDVKTFDLLFQENIAYGFRRNSLGLKPIALTIACSSIAWLFVAQRVITKQGFSPDALESLPIGSWVALATSVIMLTIWIFFLTKRTVKTAAFTYAEMLLRACDILQGKNKERK